MPSKQQLGWSRAYVILALFFLFLCATNPWLGWMGGIHRVVGTDVFIYDRMAEAAPGFSTDGIATQHAPRFLAPYLVGVTAKVTGLSVHAVFAVAALGCLAAILFTLHSTLVTMGLGPENYLVCMGLYLLNPYPVRFYLLAPGLLPDLIFVLGLALAASALLRGRGLTLVIGCALASCGRQTAMGLLPGIALGLAVGTRWRGFGLARRLAWFLAAAAAVLVTQKGLVVFAEGMTPGRPAAGSVRWLLAFAVSIFPWLAGPDFKAGVLGEHVAKTCIPLLFPVAVVTGSLLRRGRPRVVRDWDLAACLMLIAGVAFLPILQNPDWIQGSECRYTAYALVVASMAAGLVFRGQPPVFTAQDGWLRLTALAGLLGLSSLHHLNSSVGPPTAASFAVFHVIIAVLAATVVARWPGTNRPLEGS